MKEAATRLLECVSKAGNKWGGSGWGLGAAANIVILRNVLQGCGTRRGLWERSERHNFIYPITGLDRPKGLQEVEAPRSFRHRPSLPPGDIPGAHLYFRLSRPQNYIATGSIKSMKNSNDPIGNRTRDLSACNAVSQPTAYRHLHVCNVTFSFALCFNGTSSLPRVHRNLERRRSRKFSAWSPLLRADGQPWRRVADSAAYPTEAVLRVVTTKPLSSGL